MPMRSVRGVENPSLWLRNHLCSMGLPVAVSVVVAARLALAVGVAVGVVCINLPILFAGDAYYR